MPRAKALLIWLFALWMLGFGQGFHGHAPGAAPTGVGAEAGVGVARASSNLPGLPADDCPICHWKACQHASPAAPAHALALGHHVTPAPIPAPASIAAAPARRYQGRAPPALRA